MAKLGCPVCGRAYGAGHRTISDCPQIKSEVTVEKIKRPELSAPSTVHQDYESTVLPPDGTVHTNTGTVHTDQIQSISTVRVVPKNRAWEARNSVKNRAWRREYDRKRRSRGKLAG